MKFDLKDVKVGDEGYFFHAIDILKGSESECLKPIKSVLFTLRNNIEKVLITHLEYDANHNLISINGQSLKSLFENYEIITDDGKIIPFGVEVKDE